MEAVQTEDEYTGAALALVPEEPKEPSAVTCARQSIQSLGYRLSAQFVERNNEIRGLLLALIARQHVMLLGVPGTGKSALVNAMCAALSGAKHFQWLLTRYSVPDEIFGTLSLAGLKEDRFRRITANKLPEAQIAFLDEIWKASSSILNALLTVVNERVFHNDGQAVEVPLEMLVGASNELPESEELTALYDRFLFRFQVEPIAHGYNFFTMLDGTIDPFWLTYEVSLDTVHQAQEAAAALPIEKPVLEALYEIKRACVKEAIQVSDRRWKASLSALRAAAFLDSDPSVSTVHLEVLRDIIWSEPAQKTKVDEIVAQYAVSASSTATMLVDTLLDEIRKLESLGGDERTKKLPVITREGKRAADQLDAMLTTATSNRERNGITSQRKRLTDNLAGIRAEAMKAMGLG